LGENYSEKGKLWRNHSSTINGGKAEENGEQRRKTENESGP